MESKPELPFKRNSARFLKSLQENGLQQHICAPTHEKGHTLNLIISPADECIVKCQVLPTLGSDHELISCIINCNKPKSVKILRTVRNFKSIDSDSFNNDLLTVLGDRDFGDGSADEMLGMFNSSILSVLDTHAP